jgi:glycosyltransferase involved in cell wall biosynthesis
LPARHFHIAESSYAAAEELFEQLRGDQAQEISIGDLIQRLEDPRPLLRTLRRVLQLNQHNRLLVSILDPVVSARRGNEGAASAYIRVWSRNQARAFFAACGFEIVAEHALPFPSADASPCNYSFALSCSDQHYRSHLRRFGLPPPSLEYVLFSTEHSACKVSGGIGAYAEQMERLLPPEKFALCYVGHPKSIPPDADRRWIFPSLFFEGDEWTRLPVPVVALRQLQALVFLYPGLKLVEFQEYLALGHLVGAAKRAALLPDGLVIKTRCHGSQLYLEACFSRWTGFEHLELTYQEKVSIEQADIVSLPTRFLLQMYRSRGYVIADSKIEIRQYPFEFSLQPQELSYNPIDTLIFFGKRTRMKGFPIFLDAVARLLQDPARTGIKRLVVIGKIDATLEDENRRLEQLASRMEVIEFEGSRADAIALIQRYAGSAICAMPYQSDNHPMAVLEAAATGCTPLAANAGGIPEMIPPEFHSTFLHELSSQGLYDSFVRILDLPVAVRRSSTEACLAALVREYGAVNASHLADDMRSRDSRQPAKARSTVGVIVPCFNSKLEHIRDLVHGLNSQSWSPDEVCFVDDGSRQEFASELEAFLSGHLAAPFRVVRHEINRGLAGARNTGLRQLHTDYAVNIDSDDIPKPDFLANYVHYLDRDPEVVSVTSWLESFHDATNWLESAHCHLSYRPIGDGLLLAQIQNCLGHANSAFRREYLLSIGGWDDADKSMWEDWGLLVRIVSSGGRIGVVPKSNILYRVNTSSMVRTYAQFPAMNRLARNIVGLPTFESFRLQAVMRSFEELLDSHERLRQDLEYLRDQLSSKLSFRIARRSSEIANRHPLLKAPLKKAFLLVESALNRPSNGNERRSTESP